MLPPHLTLPRCLGTMLILTSIGCRPAQPDVVDSAVTDSGPEPAGPIQRIAFSLSESNPLARYVEVTLTTPASIQLEFWVTEGPHFQKTFEELETTHTLPLIGLHPDALNHLIVHAVSEGETIDSSETLDIETLPLDFEPPQFDVKVPMEPDGIITALGLSSELGDWFPASYLGIDRNGQLVWVGRAGRTTPGARFFEPTQDGLFIDYTKSNTANGTYTFDVISPTSDYVREYPSPFTIHHDGAVLPNGNLITMSKIYQQVDVPDYGEIQLTGDSLAEITQTGEVLWEWSSFEHLDTTRFPVGDSQIKSGDWSHANSIMYLKDSDELVVSFRNQNQVIVIQKSTGEVTRTIGEDGDYTLISGEWFFGQHHATLESNDVLTVFDNHFISSTETTSRVVQYQINEAEKTIEEIWSFDLGHFYRSAGEAAVLSNGGLLIAAGGAARDEGAPISVIEFNESRDIIWHIEVPAESIPMVFRTSRINAGTL